MFKLQKQFKIRILYKSGSNHDFWVSDFTVKGGTSYKWTAISESNNALQIGVDDIAAVWVIDTRYRFAK